MDVSVRLNLVPCTSTSYDSSNGEVRLSLTRQPHSRIVVGLYIFVYS